MIIARSPLRISLGGGGTDLPSYYEKNGGHLIAAAIDKYVYTTVTRPFASGIYLKYSALENVDQVDQVQHNIIRETLRIFNLKTPQIEITTLADIPAGTGLGSSGSFTTSLIKALYTHYKKSIDTKELAQLACEIEIEMLNQPIGKQDQYIAAYGGITSFTFNQDNSVEAIPLVLPMETLHDLEDNLLLFYTGISRAAVEILRDQDAKSISNNFKMMQNLDVIKEIGERSKEALESGDLIKFSELLRDHWELKQARSLGVSNEMIDHAYQTAIRNGALGGKLVGAGGGGFLMFYARDRENLRFAMKKLGLEEIRFKFDFEGTKVILS
jgi:D-glycero-alpha-D-manno-heptose-7-phosphate kinase